jgi:hypothetical protein
MECGGVIACGNVKQASAGERRAPLCDVANGVEFRAAATAWTVAVEPGATDRTLVENGGGHQAKPDQVSR